MDTVQKPKFAIFGGSFNPPTIAHWRIVFELLAGQLTNQSQPLADKVIIIPCGMRPDKATTNYTDKKHRRNMLLLVFEELLRDFNQKLAIDWSDLENDNEFARAYDIEQRYSDQGEVWHVVGGDLVFAKQEGQSEIQQSWYRGQELWDNGRFLIFRREGFTYFWLPRTHRLVDLTVHFPMNQSSTLARQHDFQGIVYQDIARYINSHELYQKGGQ